MTETLERFWAKVDKNGPIVSVELGPCWIWTAFVATDGYGRFAVNGNMVQAHRYSYELANGFISEDMHVLHKCDTKICVRPDHLFSGTEQTNMEDKVAKNRQSKGENHGNHKLTWEIVYEIRERYARGDTSCPRLAECYGISQRAIWNVVNNMTWRVENV